MRARLIPALTAVALIAVLVGMALRDDNGPAGSSPSAVSEHPVVAPSAERTVLVSRTMPMPSAHARRLSAMLEEGAMPSGPAMADVMTDTDCAPDAQMISRCRNLVRLDDGRQIVLRHPHDMRKVPCLGPGERVRLVPTGI